MDINSINNKAYTSQLVDYLETTVGDEMILNSFVRDIEVVFSNDTKVIVEVSSKEAQRIFNDKIKTTFLNAIEQVFEKKLVFELLLKGKYKSKNLSIFDEEKNAKKSKNISSKHKFSNYVVSSFNKEAVSIAEKLIKKPGFFSPFYLNSKSGLGKTHLLHAIANKFSKNNVSCIYFEPSLFTRKIQNLSKEGGDAISQYIDDILEFDVLIFDDIQNLGDRVVTLRVLFTIINKAIETEKQIIIAADRVAEELSGFEFNFITRFKSGISSTIKQPQLEDLIKILEFKIDKEGMSSQKWEKEAIKFIARNNSSSIRAIEGAVKRVVFFTENESNITYTYTVISNIFKELEIDPAELTPTRILKVVSNYYKINKNDIIGKSRKREYIIPRNMSIWLIRKINKLSYVEIGKIIGGRDHSTIISSITKIEHQMKLNNAVKVAARKIESKIKSIS